MYHQSLFSGVILLFNTLLLVTLYINLKFCNVLILTGKDIGIANKRLIIIVMIEQ